MARLNIAPTKSNLLVMNEQLAISQDGYELLEQKREILVMELMRMVEQVKLLEQRINAQVEKAFPALRKMLLVTGVDTVERLSQAVQYDFQIHEKEMSAGGMSFLLFLLPYLSVNCFILLSIHLLKPMLLWLNF